MERMVERGRLLPVGWVWWAKNERWGPKRGCVAEFPRNKKVGGFAPVDPVDKDQ